MSRWCKSVNRLLFTRIGTIYNGWSDRWRWAGRYNLFRHTRTRLLLLLQAFQELHYLSILWIVVFFGALGLEKSNALCTDFQIRNNYIEETYNQIDVTWTRLCSFSLLIPLGGWLGKEFILFIKLLNLSLKWTREWCDKKSISPTFGYYFILWKKRRVFS